MSIAKIGDLVNVANNRPVRCTCGGQLALFSVKRGTSKWFRVECTECLRCTIPYPSMAEATQAGRAFSAAAAEEEDEPPEAVKHAEEYLDQLQKRYNDYPAWGLYDGAMCRNDLTQLFRAINVLKRTRWGTSGRTCSTCPRGVPRRGKEEVPQDPGADAFTDALFDLANGLKGALGITPPSSVSEVSIAFKQPPKRTSGLLEEE